MKSRMTFVVFMLASALALVFAFSAVSHGGPVPPTEMKAQTQLMKVQPLFRGDLKADDKNNNLPAGSSWKSSIDASSVILESPLCRNALAAYKAAAERYENKSEEIKLICEEEDGSCDNVRNWEKQIAIEKEYAKRMEELKKQKALEICWSDKKKSDELEIICDTIRNEINMSPTFIGMYEDMIKRDQFCIAPADRKCEKEKVNSLPPLQMQMIISEAEVCLSCGYTWPESTDAASHKGICSYVHAIKQDNTQKK